MTYLWEEKETIKVEVASQTTQKPIAITWRGRRHPVAEVTKHWRLHTDWWTSRKIWRDYFQLTTVTGLLVDIYLDQIANQWYLNILYD